MEGFAGKVATVTGAGSGIGRALALELGRSGASLAISDVELASRLSYFLWSSMPDDTLSALAEAGKLREPGVLDAQVKRMLAGLIGRVKAED